MTGARENQAGQMDVMSYGANVADVSVRGPERGAVAISEPMSIFMDHVRWISAFLVIIGHIRQIYFVDFQEIAHPSGFWAAFYGVTRLSHQAVLMFFLISGGVIAGRFMHSSGWKRFDLKAYAVARLTRLWLVLLPVVAVCVALLMVTPQRYLPEECTLSALQVLGNIFFVQEILVPPLCNNIPLWSLANEFWYYVIMGLAVFVAVTPSMAARVAAVLFLAASVAMIATHDAFTEKNVLAYFPVWLLGAAVFLPRLPAPPVWVGLSVLAGAVVLVRSPSLPFDFYVRDLIFAAAAFLALLSVRDVRAGTLFARLMTLTSGIARTLAGQSYSLYLVHYPIVILFIWLVADSAAATRQQPSAYGFGMVLVMVAACYVVAQLSYLCLESRTHQVRALIMRRLGWGR